MQEQLVPPDLLLLQDAERGELLEIGRCGVAGCNPLLDEIADTAVGPGEDLLDHRMRHLRRDGADVSGRLIHQRADGPDLLRRPYRGLLDAGKYVENPRLPLLLEGHLAQPTIVVAARLENIAAEIERGQVQQA